MPNMRENSKASWTGKGTMEDINCGSLQRIADAVEKMAESYDRVREERDRLKKRVEWRDETIERLHHQNCGLRGYITRLKKAR